MRDEIPPFPIPLRPNEDEPVLELSVLLRSLYESGGYDMAIDYNRPAEPPLAAADQEWAKSFLTAL